MNKSTLQQKGDSFLIELCKKCIINNKKLCFQDLCKDNVSPQFDDKKLGNLFLIIF